MSRMPSRISAWSSTIRIVSSAITHVISRGLYIAEAAPPNGDGDPTDADRPASTTAVPNCRHQPVDLYGQRCGLVQRALARFRLDIFQSGIREHRNRESFRVMHQLLAELQAVYHRRHQIEQNDAWSQSADDLVQRFTAVARRDDDPSVRLEQHA